jgi:hypothetical protein
MSLRSAGHSPVSSLQSGNKTRARLRSAVGVILSVLLVAFAGACGGSSNSAANNTPAIVGITPNITTAGSADLTITVSGANFISGAVVMFGTTALTTTFVSASQLTAVVPAASLTNGGVINVTVVNPDKTASAAVGFAIAPSVPPPAISITSIQPASAVAGSGAFTLTVNGSGFTSSSVLSFNSVKLTTTLVNVNQVTATIPATAITTAGTVPVTVTNPPNFTVNVGNSVNFTILP